MKYKFFSRALWTLAVIVCPVFSFAQNLTVLHVNDTHSHIDPVRGGEFDGKGGVIERAAYVDSVRLADGKKNVLLLHAGDFSQGTSYFTELHGNIEISVINALGYDAVCLGNHEFDNGLEELARRLKSLECPVVCANYDFSKFTVGKYVKPYAILKKAGLKIGVIGLLTDVTSVVDRAVADKLAYLDPASTAEHYASYLKKDRKCDIVICLTHLGYEGDYFDDMELAASTRNVDVIVGGHSHTLIDSPSVVPNADGRDVVIVTDGEWGIYVGELKLSFDK